MQKYTIQQEFDKRLKKVILALCTSLRFQQCGLYMHENEEEFCIRTTAGVTPSQEEYLRQHPLSSADVKMLMAEAKQVNNAYVIPYTSALWQNPSTADWLLLEDWVVDVLLVPLMSEQNAFVGLLALGYSSHKEHVLTDEVLLFLDVFAEQAAMVIEEERLYKEAKQSNEERTALIEIGRALFAPSALQDLEHVYRTIYDQTRKIMPIDALPHLALQP